MSWVSEFTPAAEEDLKALPKAIQRRVARVTAQMSEDPFRGNVKALQGADWKGIFRRRMGDYRLLFSANQATKTVTVLQICRRSGKTYR